MPEKGRKFGFFVIAGGRVRVNESSEDAAKREIYEEINISEGFYILDKEEIKQKIIQPKILHAIINSESKEITHY